MIAYAIGVTLFCIILIWRDKAKSELIKSLQSYVDTLKSSNEQRQAWLSDANKDCERLMGIINKTKENANERIEKAAVFGYNRAGVHFGEGQDEDLQIVTLELKANVLAKYQMK